VLQVEQYPIKSGITDDLGLLMHLPLRYEDETHLYPIRDIPEKRTVQVEGVIIHSEILFRPRRQLVCQVDDGSGVLVMRFLNFYGSQVKAYSAGARVRLLGEPRPGFFGMEMVHPKCRIINQHEPLADTLTRSILPPVSSRTIHKLIRRALEDTGSRRQRKQPQCAGLRNTASECFATVGFAWFKNSVVFLHQPPPDVSAALLEQRTHPAWRRIKFDELLAQQLSMRLHYRRRRNGNAPVLRQRTG
jgi:ATP-dependent DNA helicase RecG